MQLKIRGLIILVLFVAFFWGYKRDSFFSLFSSSDPALQEQGASGDQATAPANALQTFPPQTPSPAAVLPTLGTSPGSMSASDASTGNISAAGMPMPTAGMPTAGMQGAGMPAGGIAASTPARPSLSQTLDSIRPGEITEQMKNQRDAYIQKLAQQLRETQGGDPMATPIPIIPGAQPFATPALFPAPPTEPIATPEAMPGMPVAPFAEATPPVHSQGFPLPPIDQVMPQNPDPDVMEEGDDEEEEEDTEGDEEDLEEEE